MSVPTAVSDQINSVEKLFYEFLPKLETKGVPVAG